MTECRSPVLTAICIALACMAVLLTLLVAWGYNNRTPYPTAPAPAVTAQVVS